MIASRSRLGIALALICLVVPALASAEEKAVLVDYVVQKGDTCVRIAKRELGSRSAYKDIHRHNPEMGKTPHRLVPGTVLKLPSREREPDAHVTDRQGTVQFRPPSADDWKDAAKGTPLFRAWRVNSREKSSAELTFADDSAIRLRENTLVIVYGPTSERTRKQTAYASLERGTLRARLGELDRGAPVIVETPGSQAEIGSGSALVSVDGEGTSRIANHEGAAVVVRSRGKRPSSVDVAVGMGSKVKKDKAPEKPRPLPPTPVWERGTRHAVAFAATGGTLRGKWREVAEAAEYRVEIAIDPIARAVVASVIVPSSVTEFEASGLPAGQYYASVAAIDADKFESIPSARETMKLTDLSVDGDSSGETGGALRVVSGAVIRMPGELRCGQGAAEPTQALVVIGATPLRCLENGVEVPAPAIAVVPLQTVIASDRSVRRGAAESIVISLAADGLAVPTLEVRGKGLEVASVEQSPDELRLSVVADETVESASITLLAKGTETVLAILPIELEARAEEPPPPVVVETQPLRRWQLGLFSELSVGSREFAIEGGLEPAASLGLRAARHQGDRVFVELEASYGRPTLRAIDVAADEIAARAALGLDLVGSGDAAAFALAGAAILYLGDQGDEVAVGGHYGVGFRLPVAGALLVRADLRHIVLPAAPGPGLASQLIGQLGLAARF